MEELQGKVLSLRSGKVITKAAKDKIQNRIFEFDNYDDLQLNLWADVAKEIRQKLMKESLDFDTDCWSMNAFMWRC